MNIFHRSYLEIAQWTSKLQLLPQQHQVRMSPSNLDLVYSMIIVREDYVGDLHR